MNQFSSLSKAALNNHLDRALRSDFLPYFLLNQGLSVLVSPDVKHFSKTLYISKSFWNRFFLLTKLSIPSSLVVVVDGVQFTSSVTKVTIQFNLANTILDDRTSVYTTVFTDNLNLSTVSLVFKSCIWLERELSDFTNINFFGLIDTRRLLLDYFEVKTFWQTHVSNDKNYNETLYDVFLAY